jgi:NitT/TauT family transport system substrate-binding protein
MKRLIGAAFAGILGLSGPMVALDPAQAQTLEKTHIEIGVGGKPLFYYLPLTIAEQKGFFKDEGLDVTINDFGGGAQALQSLIGGSVDAVTGAYEHTIRMQQKGQSVVATLELGRFPGIVVGVAKAQADTIKTIADLKGKKIGVTAPGSSTQLTLTYLLAKAGLSVDDVSIVGVGGGASAVAAMENGTIDAISHLEPVISKLEADNAISILVDTRTEAGTRSVYGATNPAAVLYLKGDFIKANPKTTQALTNALYRALKWLASASPEDVAAAVPEQYWLGDKPLYIRAAKASLVTYSRTGIISDEGEKSILDFLQVVDPSFNAATIDLKTTFDPTFAKEAAEKIK